MNVVYDDLTHIYEQHMNNSSYFNTLAILHILYATRLLVV